MARIIWRHISKSLNLQRGGKMALADVRINRAEQDIETLRSTQSALMDRFDSFADTLDEVLKIARDNRSRLDGIDARLNQLEEVVLENRAILLAIADHLDLTYEKPAQSG